MFIYLILRFHEHIYDFKKYNIIIIKRLYLIKFEIDRRNIIFRNIYYSNFSI